MNCEAYSIDNLLKNKKRVPPKMEQRKGRK